MKLYLLLLICFLSSISYSQFTYEWAMRIGGSWSDYIQTIQIDNQENILAYGHLSATPSNPLNINGFNISSSGMHLIKMDSNQNVIWIKSVRGQVNKNSKALAIDGEGNSYVIGVYFGTIDFDGIQLSSSEVFSSAYLVKIDNNGNYVWAKNIKCNPSSGMESAQTRSVACDNLGNIVIGGDFQGSTLNLDGTLLANLGNVSYQSNDFIAKYNSDGNVLWVKNVGSLKNSVCDFQLSIDDANAVLVTTGINNDTLIFGNDTLINPIPLSNEMLIAKFDNQGNEIWARTLCPQANNSGSYGMSVTSDNKNNVYVGGSYSGLIEGSNRWSIGVNDAFIMKYDKDGNFNWINFVSGQNFDRCNAVAVDNNQNSYMTGFFSGSKVSFGDTMLTNSMWNSSTIFLVKYDSLGTRKLIDVFGDNGSDEGLYLEAGKYDDVYFSGSFQSSTIIFNGNILSNHSTPAGDAFIAKINATISNSLNVQDLNKIDYSIFPNPMKDQLTIRIDKEIENARLKITDIKGVVVLQLYNISGKEIIITTGEFPSGMYFVDLTENGLTILKERIVTAK